MRVKEVKTSTGFGGIPGPVLERVRDLDKDEAVPEGATEVDPKKEECHDWQEAK